MRIRLPNKIWRILLDLATPENAKSYGAFVIKNRMLRRLGVEVGENVAVGRKFDFLMRRGGQLIIDSHVNISNDVSIYQFKKIKIGSFTAIASHCLFTDGNHDTSNHWPVAKGLTIGRGVFIGSGAKVVGSLTIGDNALVAAGAVVMSSVDEGAVVAGNPARKVGRRPVASAVWHFSDIWYSPATFTVLSSDPSFPASAQLL